MQHNWWNENERRNDDLRQRDRLNYNNRPVEGNWDKMSGSAFNRPLDGNWECRIRSTNNWPVDGDMDRLKSATGPQTEEKHGEDENEKQVVLASEVKNEKSRREQKFKDLKREAEKARNVAEKQGAPEIGRLYNDIEGGVMEEAERNLDAAMAAPDALQVLAELNKKKELKSVDHSCVDYIPFKKNLYIVPRVLAKLSSDEVANVRGKLKVKIRGRGAPAPVSTFEQCSLSERIMKILEKQGIQRPFPIQAQCLPCIMVSHCWPCISSEYQTRSSSVRKLQCFKIYVRTNG